MKSGARVLVVAGQADEGAQIAVQLERAEARMGLGVKGVNVWGFALVWEI